MHDAIPKGAAFFAWLNHKLMFVVKMLVDLSNFRQDSTSMGKFGSFSIVATAAFIVGGGFLFWHNGQPRRVALQSISQLASDLANPNESGLLNAVVIPMAIQSQTRAEQEQFLTKALADEISPAGVEALKRHAEFGPLKSVFPIEAPVWCSQAGVNVDDCVAFKMDRAGICAEVVMLHEGQTYRIVRCNNVKQMAGENQI